MSKNNQIVNRLLKTDLNQYDNLSMLFEMCRNLLDEDRVQALKLARKIENKANTLARKDTRFYELYIPGTALLP